MSVDNVLTGIVNFIKGIPTGMLDDVLKADLIDVLGKSDNIVRDLEDWRLRHAADENVSKAVRDFLDDPVTRLKFQNVAKLTEFTNDFTTQFRNNVGNIDFDAMKQNLATKTNYTPDEIDQLTGSMQHILNRRERVIDIFIRRNYSDLPADQARARALDDWASWHNSNYPDSAPIKRASENVDDAELNAGRNTNDGDADADANRNANDGDADADANRNANDGDADADANRNANDGGGDTPPPRDNNTGPGVRRGPNGEILASKVIPDFGLTWERMLMHLHIRGRIKAALEGGIAPHKGLARLNIAKRYMRPVVDYVDDALKSSGVRDSFIELKGDMLKITDALKNGGTIDGITVTPEIAADMIRQRFAQFAADPDNIAGMKNVREHLDALRKEVDAMTPVGKYDPKTGIIQNQKEALQRYINDMDKTLEQFSSETNSFGQAYIKEITDAAANGSTADEIAENLTTMMSDRLGRLGDDVFVRQERHMVKRDDDFLVLRNADGTIKPFQRAPSQDVRRLERQLDFGDYNQYDATIKPVDPLDANSELIMFRILNRWRALNPNAPTKGVKWNVDDQRNFIGDVESMVAAGQSHVVTQAMKILNLRAGPNAIETIPADFITHARNKSLTATTARERRTWKNILGAAEYKWDDNAKFGPREINLRFAADLAEFNLINTAYAGNPGIMRWFMSKPGRNIAGAFVQTNFMKRPFAWITGGDTYARGLNKDNFDSIDDFSQIAKSDGIRWKWGFGRPKGLSDEEFESMGMGARFNAAAPWYLKAPGRAMTGGWNLKTTWPFDFHPMRWAIGGTAAVVAGQSLYENRDQIEDNPLGWVGGAAQDGISTALTPWEMASRGIIGAQDLVFDDGFGALTKYPSAFFGLNDGKGYDLGIPLGEGYDAANEWIEGLFAGENADPNATVDPNATPDLATIKSVSANNLAAMQQIIADTTASYGIALGNIDSYVTGQTQYLDEKIAAAADDAEKANYETLKQQMIETTTAYKTQLIADRDSLATSAATDAAKAQQLDEQIRNATDADAANALLLEQKGVIEGLANRNKHTVMSRTAEMQGAILNLTNAITAGTPLASVQTPGTLPDVPVISGGGNNNGNNNGNNGNNNGNQQQQQQPDNRPQWQKDYDAVKSEANGLLMRSRTAAGLVGQYVSNNSNEAAGAAQILTAIEAQEKAITDLQAEFRANGQEQKAIDLERVLFLVRDGEASIIQNKLALEQLHREIATDDNSLQKQAEALATQIKDINTFGDTQNKAPGLLRQLKSVTEQLETKRTEAQQLLQEIKNQYSENAQHMSDDREISFRYGNSNMWNEGLTEAGGGKYGILNQFLGTDSSDQTSVVGGWLKTAWSGVAGIGDWWGDVKNNARTQSERNWLNAIETGAGIFGSLAVFNFMNEKLFGNKIQGVAKWGIMLAVGAYFLNRSGKVGEAMANTARGYSPYAAQSNGSNSSYGATSRNGTTHVPTGSSRTSTTGGSNNPPASGTTSNTTSSEALITDRDGNKVSHIVYTDGQITVQNMTGGVPGDIRVDPEAAAQINAQVQEELERIRQENGIDPAMTGAGNHLPNPLKGRIETVNINDPSGNVLQSVSIDYKITDPDSADLTSPK